MDRVLDRPAAAARGGRTGKRTGERAGHVVAAGVNGVLLWVSHQLLEWGWPRFLTDDFELVLGVLTASLVVGVLAELWQVVAPGARTRAVAELATSCLSVAVAVRTWEVFPFDFGTYATDWSGVARVVLVVAIVGALVAVVVNLGRLVVLVGTSPRST